MKLLMNGVAAWHAIFVETVGISNHTGALLILGGVLFLVLMKSAADVFGIRHANWLSETAFFLAGLVCALLVTGAVHVYGIPFLAGPVDNRWALIAIAFASVALIVVPAQSFVQRAPYLQEFFSWLVGFASALIVIVLLHAVVELTSSGSRDFGRVRHHKDVTEDFLRQ